MKQQVREARYREPGTVKRMLVSIRRGSLSGVLTSWTLIRIMVPTMIVVQILKITGMLDVMASMGAPFMDLFGLPGEGSLVLITGALVNIYAAIAVAVNIPLTAKGMTILAIMVLIAHNLIVETAVQSQSGTPAWITLPVRITTALLAGLLFAWFIPGGGEVIVQAGIPAGAEGLGPVLLANGASLIKIILIITGLMVAMDLSQEFGLMEIFTTRLGVPMKLMGIDRKAAVVTAVGLLLGLAYGAGLIINETRHSNIRSKEILAANLFLGTNHALIEDTLIFVAVGAGLGWILIGRLVIGFVILRISLPLVLYFWNPDGLVGD